MLWFETDLEELFVLIQTLFSFTAIHKKYGWKNLYLNKSNMIINNLSWNNLCWEVAIQSAVTIQSATI